MLMSTEKAIGGGNYKRNVTIWASANYSVWFNTLGNHTVGGDPIGASHTYFDIRQGYFKPGGSGREQQRSLVTA